VVYDAASLDEFVAHLEATFDPFTCTTCTLFSYCRQELRDSEEPTDLLIELGVPRDVRLYVAGMVDGTGEIGTAPASTQAMIAASLDGVAQPTRQARVDQAGQPGTLNVVIAKSDSAALGVYGVAVQRVVATGRSAWHTTVFDDPQASDTRRAIMKILGRELSVLIRDRRKASAEAPSPIHVVVPDQSTADVLASIADNLAGIELSRLRWDRDKQLGRPALTFNGEPAQIPPALPESDRTAVSFLLEEDRARALTLRSPIVDARAALSRHLVAGGPAVNSLRLDYLVAWAEATRDQPIDHRAVTDYIENSEYTPGARLTSRRSNTIHQAFTGTRVGAPRPADPAAYDALVRDELAYKCDVLERALTALDAIPDSTLREVHRAIEGDAQAVWRRRLKLHASDLVRFGRTYRHWRNSLVPTIESDAKCAQQLLVMANPQSALDAALNAGTRELAKARVIDRQPLTVEVESRRIGDGSRIVLLHVNGEACVEDDDTDVAFQKGSFKFSGFAIGPLFAFEEEGRRFLWAPENNPDLAAGDQLVVADFRWFSTKLKGNKQLPVNRPTADEVSAPKPDCTSHSYADDPERHQYCCRPHEVAEAEWSDTLAERRARGELNPQVWPPVVDGDAFEVSAAGAPQGDPADRPPEPVPEEMTMDDVD
jgi:hypothetical protein